LDFSLTEDQQSIQRLALEFAQNELAPHAQEWDEKCHFPKPTLKKAAALGFSGIYVKDDIGGCDLSRLDAILIFESLSQGCVSTAAYLSIHNMVCWMMDHYGNEDQRKKWLPKLINMDHFSSYCLTEPGSGSDAASLKTKAVKDGDHYVLNGSKAFISGGGESDVYLCMVRTGEDGPKGISCLIVENGTKGLSFGKKEKKMGWNSQPTTMVQFDNCHVPIQNLLGSEGDGFKIAMEGLNGGRLNIAACSLGGAQSALNAAQEHMAERVQFGKHLSEFQGLQFMFSDMATELEAARLMVYKGGIALSKQEHNAPLQCAMAKRFATDVGFRVANEALQLFGGYGYIKEYNIERIVRDLRVHQILEGTNEIMRLIIARHLLGRN
jgi:alkylation response protein AidB-like acyl-CoA dehydrogenase